MNTLTESQGYLFLALFAITMIAMTLLVSKNKSWTGTQIGFLKAGSNVPWGIGAFSIAASWIWAPALFVSVQKSYELGLPGMFWFIFPNILALIVFAFLAPKIRKRIPGGYTLPEWILYRFKNRNIHNIYLFIYFWYQVMAITIQIFVGGLLINFFTGIPLNYVMILLLIIGLSYSMISGLRASIVTDFLQMIMIFGAGIIIIPWTISSGGGWEAVEKGFGGLANNTNIFDWNVVYSFGIVTSIGLIAGSISDQQYWQRSFAIKKNHLAKSFIWGGIFFGIVPLTLSVLGFMGANPELGIQMPEGVQLPMIGVAVVGKLLPTWAAVLFIIMLMSGLSSTLDSGFAAGASLWAIDIVRLSKAEKEVMRKERLDMKLSIDEESIKLKLDHKTPQRARQAMVGLAIIGLIVALLVEYIPGFGLDKLWWVFNAIASMAVLPTILSLYWDKLSAKGVLLGFIGSFIGIIGFIWGNAIGNTNLIVFSAVFIVVISLIMNLTFPNKEAFKD
jgi:urea-proton symporter